MVEESSNISFSGDDALVYSAEPIHKKYYKTFVWGHPFSTHVPYDQFFSPCTSMHAFRVTPSCVCDFIDLILSSPILTLIVYHSFLCFTSEIQELMFLFQTPTSSWHLIEFPVAYLGRPFH